MKTFKRQDEILVSIIVPVYNEKKYLRSCVESIKNQEYKNIEIVLVDDGSTDGTSEDCDEIAKTDSRIVVIHKENEGLSAARITGLERSSGSWIMFVDDDDIVSPYIVSSFVDGIASEEIDIVTGGRVDSVYDLYEWKKSTASNYNIMSGRRVVEEIPIDKQKTIITPLWGKLYKRDFLRNINYNKYKSLCPTIYFEDVLVTPMIYAEAKMINVINTVFYLHREVASSISRSGKLSSFYYEQIYSGNVLLKYCKENQLNNYYSYQLKIYMNSILRISVLANQDILKEYNADIEKYYTKYLKDYIKYSNESIAKKTVISLYKICPALWRKLAKRVIYKL